MNIQAYTFEEGSEEPIKVKAHISEDYFLKVLEDAKEIAFDTETTGLMPYHGDRPFALIFRPCDSKYNFYVGTEDVGAERLLKIFRDPNKIWFMHNAKFDMHHMAEAYGIYFAGTVMDTMTGARLEYNDHMSYSLASCASRIGLKKDDAVEAYITDNKLWEWQDIPGKKTRRKNKFYMQVPDEIIVPYACKDTELTYRLADHQAKRIDEIDSLLPDGPKLINVLATETKVTKAIFEMERSGVKADIKYCEEMVEKCKAKELEAVLAFESLSGSPYKASPKLFEKIFEDEMENWGWTEKGNPSFDSESLAKLKHPAAVEVLKIRDLKSRMDFLSGFIWYADKNDYVHPNLNPAGTATGRLSSSDPNFQNLTNDDEAGEDAIKVRRAIIPPSEDFCIVSIDFKQQEYCLLLDYAGETDLIEKVKAGADVHQATAEMMGVTRREAKTLNFMLLYGGGAQKLADALGVSLEEAKRLKTKYFSVLPNVKKLIQNIISTAEKRGYVYNWAGRRFWCDREHAYKMPNRIIQGGGADIMKECIAQIHECLYATHCKSRMFMTIHDEICFYVHKEELHVIENIKRIMENVYKPKNGLPLKVSISHSWKSLADLEDGAPKRKDDEMVAWGQVGVPDTKELGGIMDAIMGSMKDEVARRLLGDFPEFPKVEYWGGAGNEPLRKLKPEPRPNEITAKHILKAFGLNGNVVRKFKMFNVDGHEKLWGSKDDKHFDVLARLDAGVLKYQLKEMGLDPSELKPYYTGEL